MLAHFWWGSVFLLGPPVTVVAVIVGLVVLPADRGSGAGRLDVVSVALSLLALLPIIYAVKELARQSWWRIPALVAGLIAGAAFLRRQRRLADPLLAAAREAFTTGVHAVAVVGVVLFTAMAILIARNLRHIPPT